MDKQNDNKNWFRTRWRPAMGWLYLMICLFDFIIAPIFWTTVQLYIIDNLDPKTKIEEVLVSQWEPLTLGYGGVFHIAMGAIVTTTSYGRTKEKIKGVADQEEENG